MDLPVLLTIAVSLLVALACVWLRPGTALGVVIASCFLWPEYLRFPLGIVQMSAPRMGAVILMVRMLMVAGANPPRWRLTDTLVVALYLWYVLANFLARTPDDKFRTLIGSGFDTVLMYLVARRVFSDPKQVVGIVKGLAVTALVMAPLGAIENITRSSPYLQFLQSRQGEEFQGGGSEIRMGMRRAFGSTEQPIFYGMGMLAVTGMLISLRGAFETRWSQLSVLAASVLAVLTSLSSGPWAGLAVLLAINSLFIARSLIKPAIGLTVMAMVAMEALSNRHFYHLISYLSLDGASAYYRSRLMEVAVLNLDEYWAIGNGGKSLTHWGPMIDGRWFVDMVNNYVIAAVNGGLLAMALYIAIKISVLVTLVVAFQRGQPPMKPVCFGFAAMLVGISLSEISVGLFGPPLLMSYIVLGCSVSCAEWVRVPASRVPRRPERSARPVDAPLEVVA